MTLALWISLALFGALGLTLAAANLHARRRRRPALYRPVHAVRPQRCAATSPMHGWTCDRISGHLGAHAAMAVPDQSGRHARRTWTDPKEETTA